MAYHAKTLKGPFEVLLNASSKLVGMICYRLSLKLNIADLHPHQLLVECGVLLCLV